MAPFDYALAHGFDAFEWFPDKKADGAGWDEWDLDPSARSAIRQAARSRGMRLSVHGRCLINPSCTDGDPLLRRDMELVHALGAAVLVLHLNPNLPMHDFARALLVLLKWAAASEVQIAIENTPAATPEHFRKLFAALAELNPPGISRIGMCLDIGHANLCAATRNDYLGYLDQLDDAVPISHVHVHENWGDADTHLTLFTGPSEGHSQGVQGLLRRLRQRGYSGSLILEQWPQPPALLDRARNRLLDLWHALDERKPAPSETQSIQSEVS